MKVLTRLGAALAVTIFSLPAQAQNLGGLALDQLQPTPAGDPFFAVASPVVPGHLVPRGFVMMAYAHQPLTLTDGATNTPVVSGQAFMHVNASLALWDRLLIYVTFPFAVAQLGDPNDQGITFKPGVAASDLRVGLRVRFYGEERDPFQIGVSADLYVPTGPKDSLAAEGSIRDMPQLLLGGQINRFVYSATFGAMIRASENPSALTYAAALGVKLWDDRIIVGPEFYGSTLLRGDDVRVGERSAVPREAATNAELLFGGRVSVWKGLMFGAAVGPGLTKAIGTPSIRALGMIAWSPSSEKREDPSQTDADQDGIMDKDDACPHAFGPKNADTKRNGCPARDGDEDGILDEDDACPDQKGDKSDDKAKNGCPADRDGDGVPDTVDACPDQKGDSVSGCPALADADGDGIPDKEDACPNVKGDPSGNAVINGCPVNSDRDGDGVLDKEDACVADKGQKTSDAKTNGCPKYVRVTAGEITLLSPIGFKIAKKDPPPFDGDAESILDEVAAALKAHPEIVKLEIGGHTDDVGNAGFNERSSLSKAEAVKAWLVGKGIDASRLVTKGYGPAKPIADNKTAEGRIKNKRITLAVIEKK